MERGILSDELLALDEAIGKLERESPRKAWVVQLRFFVGMNHDEVAAALEISSVTARRHLRYLSAVNPRTNLGRCFHCETNFNPIDFLIAAQDCDFVEAVRYLTKLLPPEPRTTASN